MTAKVSAFIPLAEKLRPSSLEEIIGQTHLLGEDGWIKQVIRGKRPLSILLWGPPGCGKTTLARLYAKAFDAEILHFSGVSHGIVQLKKAFQQAKDNPLFSRHLIVFIDEIHRYNKAQQDALLPYVEDGTITLIGATTENPSFSLNNALLSRLRTLVLHPLTEEDLSALIDRYEALERALPLDGKGKEILIRISAGDGRHLLNMLENLSTAPSDHILAEEELLTYLQSRSPLYDKADDGHYNLISALHKSVRGSDPDASLYWLARILTAGEDPRFVARRLIRMASEDIGLADPGALSVTLEAWQAYNQLGSPEGELALAQATLYLALAPKSNAAYTAFNQAWQLAKETAHLSPPKHILNAPTKLMKDLDYSKGYRYDHDQLHAFSGQNYFPNEVERKNFYHPAQRGFEREMQKRMQFFEKLRNKND